MQAHARAPTKRRASWFETHRCAMLLTMRARGGRAAQIPLDRFVASLAM